MVAKLLTVEDFGAGLEIRTTDWLERGATGAVDYVRFGLPRIEDCLVADRIGYPCRDSKSTYQEMLNPTDLDQEAVEGSKNSRFEENRFSELQAPLRENDDRPPHSCASIT